MMVQRHPVLPPHTAQSMHPPPRSGMKTPSLQAASKASGTTDCATSLATIHPQPQCLPPLYCVLLLMSLCMPTVIAAHADAYKL